MFWGPDQLSVEDPMKDFIRPAVDGTLSVLKAAKVRRNGGSCCEERLARRELMEYGHIAGGRHQACCGDFFLCGRDKFHAG